MTMCRSCGLVIGDQDTARRRAWCGSMRRLLVLGAVQPEDYHADCFVNRIVAKDAVEARADRRVVARHASDAFSFAPHSGVAVPA